MQVTKNFTLEEFERSETAEKYNIDNSITMRTSVNISMLCEQILQPIRDKYGPIIISSGYRCKRLNKKVGGSKNSQHMRGEAADIISNTIALYDLYLKIKDSNLDYDQLIYEFNGESEWIHISYTTRRDNRRQAFEKIWNKNDKA